MLKTKKLRVVGTKLMIYFNDFYRLHTYNISIENSGAVI